MPIEIVRKNSRLGLVVRRREEETQFNITLLEVLRQDFGIELHGLDPLPTDNSGVDLRTIYTLVRKVIKDKSRWDVEERAYLGLFSFGQFVMWNDLRSRTHDLAKNRVVASLMSGRLEWQPLGVMARTDKLDEKYHPHELLAPLSADSSQLKAIAAAVEGESFVLHGPPGTGKSQTITNIIAHMVGQGKTVLFVAEKMAALNVVQRRLAQIGLAEFSLELHSNKGNKRSVLEQLGAALESSKRVSSEDWESQGVQLAETRSKLNSFNEALHAKHANGLSVYEAITLFESVRNAPGVVRLDSPMLSNASAADIRRWLDAATELQVAGQACGGPHLHPLKELGCQDYSATLKSRAEDALQDCSDKLTAFNESLQSLIVGLGWTQVPIFTRSRLHGMSDLCAVLLETPAITTALLDAELNSAVRLLSDVSRHGVERDSLRAKLFVDYQPTIISLDAKSAHAEWIEAGKHWSIPRLLKQSRIVKQLRNYSVKGRKVNQDRIESDLVQILKLQEEERAVQNAAPTASPWVAETVWNQGDADWQAVRGAGEWRTKLEQILERLSTEDKGRQDLRALIGRELRSGHASFLRKFEPQLQALAAAYKTFLASERALSDVLFIEWQRIEEMAGDKRNWLDVSKELLQVWSTHLSGLRDWCTWQTVRAKGLEFGLGSLIVAWEAGKLDDKTVLPAWKRALYKGSVEQMMMKDEELNKFSSPLFEDTIRKFASLTDEYEQLTRNEIVARVASRVPAISETSANNSSEMGILLRAIRSGGRAMPLRKLVSQVPNLVTRISPCFLMSPLSVAQYLDVATPKFDLVIFDEASQMPTAEAVGAMARGKTVIIVGDPKQLPPTQFFASANRESEDTELSQDLESVLDDCLALGMPQGHLLWHYRSRREGLIAFSNRHYYDNRLLTFPSADELKRSVQYVFVDGTYDRGRTKQNLGEAKAVVNEIRRRLMDVNLRQQSIGVVTFNLQQKNLIEDLVEEAFANDPELESAAMSCSEPLLIKNLENVQGDERDVILFSIGYGPDETGRVSLNFGPLNRDGGWRRLNVAVSRARQEMMVFSTIHAEQIDASKSRAQGVSGLKAFLSYAEKGMSTLVVPAESVAVGRRPGLEREFACQLRTLGYVVEERVGTSEFRVDLAIVDTDHAGRYLLGIATDGETYRSAATARDRDVLRARVLSELGWRIHSVWSVDWWENPDRELDRIVAAIREARQAADATTSDVVEEEVAVVTLPSGDASSAGLKPSAASTKIAGLVTDPVPEPDPSQGPGVKANPSTLYKVAALPPANLPADAFYDGKNTRLIMEQMTQVVETEGPMLST